MRLRMPGTLLRLLADLTPGETVTMPRYTLNAKTITPELLELAKKLGLEHANEAGAAAFLRLNLKEALDARPDDELLNKQAKCFQKRGPNAAQ